MTSPDGEKPVLQYSSLDLDCSPDSSIFARLGLKTIRTCPCYRQGLDLLPMGLFLGVSISNPLPRSIKQT